MSGLLANVERRDFRRSPFHEEAGAVARPRRGETVEKCAETGRNVAICRPLARFHALDTTLFQRVPRVTVVLDLGTARSSMYTLSVRTARMQVINAFQISTWLFTLRN